jgi:hypothetical protein
VHCPQCRLKGWDSGGSSGGAGDSRVAIILVDQAAPATWETPANVACIRISRIESGMLQELGEELVSRLRRTHLVAGTLVMLFSVTNLAAAGKAAYCLDLVWYPETW